MASIRWPSFIFGRLSKQQSVVECRDKRSCGGNVAFQMSNNGGANPYGIGSIWNIAGNSQSYAYYPIHMGQANGAIEVNDRHGAIGQFNQFPAKFYYAGRLVRHDHSPSLKAKLSRAVRAFVNAWSAS